MELRRPSWIFLLIIISMANRAVVNSNENTLSYLIPCENGWFLFKDTCYKLFGKTKGLTWRQAGVSCSAHHGSLVTIESKELQDFLTIFLLLDAKSNSWIGLHDRGRESQFLWDDGSDLNYTNWEPGEPSGTRYRKEDCVEMKYSTKAKKGMWNDYDCNSVSPYICQSNKNEQSLNRDPRFCTDENDGAWSYLNSCFHVVDEAVTWDDAENYCQADLQGHLLWIIDSQTDMFLNYALSNFNKEFWIGIKEDPSNMIWTSGWPVKYKKWENGSQPYTNGDCAFMTKQKFWSSAPCSQKLPFVCEVRKDKPLVLKKGPEGWRCPGLSEDWVDLGGDTCYIFETRKPQYWLAANVVCSKKGGNLTSIHSVEETNAIHPRVIGVHDRLFIGLRRSLSNKSVFEWKDGTELDYENWKVGEPSSKNEVCGEVLTDDMTWNDASCDKLTGYICSAKKVPPAEGNEDSQHLVDTGNDSTSTLLAVFFFAVLCVIGFIIYSYTDHCRKCNNQHWKNLAFSFTSRDRTRSSEITEDESNFRI